MSEPLNKVAPSGTSSTNASAATGRYPVLKGGNAEPAAGKELPNAVAEKPDMESLAKDMNVASRSIGNDLRFRVSPGENSVVLEVIDRETGEIIRQIPQEKAAVALNANGSVGIRLFDDFI